MSAIEFWAQVGPDRTLKLPAEAAEQLRENQTIRVILVVPDGEDDHAWATLTVEQFLQGYADSDAIYDDVDLQAR